MQIFITDVDPQQCAFALDDKRVYSQINESAQILSGALHHLGMGAPDLFKPPEKPTEAIIWAAKCKPNFEWLFVYAYCMSEEWSARTGKVQASHTVIEHCGLLREGVPDGPFRTPFPNQTEFPDLPVLDAYRQHLIKQWKEVDKKPPVWSHRRPPFWTNGKLYIKRSEGGIYSVQR